jgi:uracil-DNA glycosylase family 4
MSTSPADVAPDVATLPDLVLAVEACTTCAELAATRTRTVPGQLPGGARLMIVGEAPGAAEDEQGVPFVGRSGALLDDLLAEAGLDRAAVSVVNVLKCRPPGNRPPRRAEVTACRPWLERQLALQNPGLVLALGSTAAVWFFGASARIGTLRGAVHQVDGRSVMVSYHPSAALRFGPRGAPIAALREDVAAAGRLLAGRPEDGAR